MSEKFADLRHAQSQRQYERVLEETYGFPSPKPLSPPSRSLALVQESWAEVRDARACGEVRAERFVRIEDALERLSALGIWSEPTKYLWLLVGSDGGETGFFEGALERAAVESWFAAGQDSLLIRGASSSDRYLVDRVVDDPVVGNFVELEVWSGKP